MKNASPSMATGMPRITDWGLVVTFPQLMAPLSEQTRATLSKWVMVRYVAIPRPMMLSTRVARGCQRSLGRVVSKGGGDQLNLSALVAASTPGLVHTAAGALLVLAQMEAEM
jgi:hypothetical protein